jgi:hypothetical protein
MGWAYDTAFLGYFHLSPLDLGVGVSEYILRSLDLFSPGVIIVAVLVIAVIAARNWGTASVWGLRPAEPPAVPAPGQEARGGAPLIPAAAPDEIAEEARNALSSAAVRATRLLRFASDLVPADEDARRTAFRLLLIRSGVAITTIALLLAWVASYAPVNTYLVLVLLAVGPLALTWPFRASAHGRFSYALAIVVAAVCGLWATALYAAGVGTRDAHAVVRDLPSRTAVALYSADKLGLTGPGVTVLQLPPGAQYHYEYLGLRLLLARSGTYYLLPVGWYPEHDDTYILDDSDMIRIVLYSGVVRVSN